MRNSCICILCILLLPMLACENPVEIKNGQTRPQHTEISVTITPENSGRVEITPVRGYYRIGEQITVRAISSTDFHFTSWIDLPPDQDAGKYSEEITLAVTRDQNIRAEFQRNPGIRAAVEPDGAGIISIEPDMEFYPPNTEIFLSTEAADNYFFQHWMCSANPGEPLSTESDISFFLEDSRQLTAVYQRYSSLATQIVPPGSGIIKLDPEGNLFAPGTSIHARAEAAQGYFFSSWSGPVSSLDSAVDFEVPSADSILTAYFTAEPGVHVSAEPSEGGTVHVSPQGNSHAPGTELYFSATASPGFIFSHWDINNEIFYERDTSVLIEDTIHARAVFIPRKKTILIYMAADNELESYALQDLNRLEQHDIERAGISVLILLDRPPGAGLYELQTDPLGYHPAIASRQLDSAELGLSSQQLYPINMGSPETLKAFVREGLNRFPAEQYSIIIWGHGSGWRSRKDHLDAITQSQSTGFRASAYDDGSGDALYTSELAAGLSEIKNINPLLKWTLIGLEVCKGMMMEVLYELRGLSTFVAGSPDVIPSAGWDYGLIASGLKTLDHTSQESLGILLSDSFAAVYAGTAKAAFSIIHLDEIPALHSAWNSFSSAMKSYAASEEQRQKLLHVLFYQVQDYYLTPGDLNIDMGHAAAVIASEIPELYSAAMEFLGMYQSSIFSMFASGVTNGNTSGIAIHLVPLNENGTAILPHSPAYFRDGQVSHSLDFMTDSLWPPDTQGGGLLGRLWYGE